MLARKGRATLVLFFAVVSVCNAENNLHRDVLSNRDVVTLAKAGFDEEFLIKVIVSSRTHFDTSADALAALAEQGVTQRIVEVMMNPGVAATQAGAPTRSVAEVAKPIRASKVSPARLAIMENAPYYESKSVLFGLWKRKVGVGAPLTKGALVQPQTAHYAVAR